MARPPDNAPLPSQLPALAKWPRPPSHLTELERGAWKKLGKVAMAAGTVSAADLLVCAEYARVSARVDALYADPMVKASTLASWVKISTDLLKQLGLSPHARASVAPLKSESSTSNKFQDIE